MDLKQAFEKFKLLLDWSVVDVSEPVPYYKNYVDRGRMLRGYNVRVTYQHHGVREYLFSCDDKFGLLTSELAKKQAECFARKKRENIKQKVR